MTNGYRKLTSSAAVPAPFDASTDARRPAFPGWRSTAELYADQDWIARQLAYGGKFTPELDAKARAAGFIASHSHSVGWIIARRYLGADAIPMLAPEHVFIRSIFFPWLFSKRLRIRRKLLIKVQANETLATGAPDAVRHAALRAQIERHFTPLIELLHAETALSRQAMWRLVADSVAVAFLTAGKHRKIEERARADAMAVLKQPGSPLNNRQLQFFDIVVRDDAEPTRVLARQSYRARGGCCRWYTARPGELCSTCVLKKPVERDAALEARLRRRLKLPPKSA